MPTRTRWDGIPLSPSSTDNDDGGVLEPPSYSPAPGCDWDRKCIGWMYTRPRSIVRSRRITVGWEDRRGIRGRPCRATIFARVGLDATD
eukprot:scaffold266341_cov52-Attheya_sp.AAC.2